MSITTGTFPGVRIVDMPDLGALNDTSSVVGERAGSGRFNALALRAYVDNTVLHWGATGDGVTDDTAAIQAAVNAASASGGGAVFLNAGTYRITAPINLPPHVSAFGVGPASIVAPATAGQTAFSITPTSITEIDATICELQIAPTADNCVGISAILCNNLRICHLMLTGCAGNSISLDRCRYYTIEGCLVRSSMAFPGGTIFCQSSTWNSITGGYLAGDGAIDNIEFAPMIDSPFGQVSPCIYLFSQPGTSVTRCKLAWGAYNTGPITHILIRNQCQGNTIRDNQGEGVEFGIYIDAGPSEGSVMPAYLCLDNNSYDCVGGIGIFVDGTASKPADDIVIRGGAQTEMHCTCITAAVASGGSGYAVGNILYGPEPPVEQQGNHVALQVTSVGGTGNITGASIYNGGLTQTPPTNPVAFIYGSGTGATFNLTYTGMGTGIWLRHVNHAWIDGVFFENYGGVRGGVGIMLESVYNVQVVANEISEFDRVLYCQDTAISNLIFAHNITWNNNSNDFGGNVPTFSVVQDNVGETGWTSPQPAMPASDVTVTNTAPYPQQIFISGGTVTAISYMGTSIPANTTSGQPIILTINRQHTIAITYSVAPAWIWAPME